MVSASCSTSFATCLLLMTWGSRQANRTRYRAAMTRPKSSVRMSHELEREGILTSISVGWSTGQQIGPDKSQQNHRMASLTSELVSDEKVVSFVNAHTCDPLVTLVTSAWAACSAVSSHPRLWELMVAISC